MTNRNEKLQEIWHRYEDEPGHKPTSARDAIERAVAEGILELPKIDPYDVLAGQMATALRAEFKEDSKGRRYRVNHAVRVTKGGVQYSFWASMGYASRPHMERSFTQRRELIVSECVQLKVDIDVYNELSNADEPIQLVLDFADDVAERLVMATRQARSPSPEIERDEELTPV